MKKILISKPISKIKGLFGNLDEYKARYNQLVRFFDKGGEHRLFAEPVLIREKMEISWFTDHQGQFKSYKQLNEEQQNIAKALLIQRMQHIRKTLNQSGESEEKKRIKEILEKYFEIPTVDDIFAIIANGEIKDVQIIQWGCISEAYDADRGLINKMIPADYYPMVFKAIYNDGSIAANETVLFETPDGSTEKTSDNQGIINLGEFRVYSIIYAKPAADIESQYRQQYVCTGKDQYIIKIPKIPVMKFKVIDESQNILPNARVMFAYGGQEKELTATENGSIQISGLDNGAKVTAWQMKDNEKVNVHEFSFDDESKEYPIILKGTPSDMRFKVIMKKKKPVPEADIKFKFNDKVYESKTNDQGIAYYQGIKPNEKIKAKARKGKRRGKKTFTFKNPSEEHIIKIRKPISLWWLLLLLLPFLLLIQWHKEVQFQVINDVNPANVVKANVNFTYVENDFFSFEHMRFLRSKTLNRDAKTEAGGIAKFPGVRVTLYSWLFYHSEPTQVIATAECFASDTLRPGISQLKNKKTHPVTLGPQKNNFVFKVINSQNQEPIPDAKVKLIVKSNTINKTFDAKSGVDGKAVFMGVPVCADFTIIAEAYGYENKTMKSDGKTVFHYQKDKIPLDPLTKPVVFYIKDSKNRQPIPGATAHLIISGKTIQSTRTNTNGAASMIGKGTFSNVHIIKSMMIKAEKGGYFDTASATAKVSDFIKKSASGRTLYMRPKATSLTMKVISAKTKKSVSGAKVKFTVNGKTRIEHSNSSGSVTIAGLYPNDKISVYAEKKPKYQPNNFAQNKTVSSLLDGPSSARTIPLYTKSPPPPPPAPPIPPGVKKCNGGSDATHANSSDVSTKYHLGADKGKFKFDYYTDNAPDKIIIYSGGQKVWEYYGATRKNTKSAMIPFYDPVVTVRVIGGTKWNYKVHCP